MATTQKVPIREGVFVEGPHGTTLLAGKCKSCGQMFFPKPVFCLKCRGAEIEDVHLSGRGKLYAYAIGRMPSSHFQPPYAIGHVDSVEGARVFAPLKIIEDKPFKIGMDLELVIEPLWQENDKEVIGYIFKPV